ncbi:hypothetical protein ACFVUY_28560 [Kitasatospora sp. NPDC058063]|uniref:hypothetical protein n=1 Tax=unclassified Kitasatospora TaxID=2633591 RepID=UPI0036DD24D5
MTRYSIDPERHELLATFGTGEGDPATWVASFPADRIAGRSMNGQQPGIGAVVSQ